MTIKSHKRSQNRTRRSWALLLLSFSWLLTSQDIGAQTIFKSMPAPATLLELFTSEGCSSCPHAEHWTNQLTQADELWKTLYPVVFHVDYWDYLGWDDPFASQAWSQRQRRHARLGNTSGVYTPGMLASGREWHGWRRNQHPPKFQSQGILTLRIGEKTDQFSARYQSADSPGNHQTLSLKVALLGFGLETAVKAGENRGRLLKHDFVVLDMVEATNEFDRPEVEWNGKLPNSPLATQAKRLAVVAWVSNSRDQRPQQITGGWLMP